MRILSDVFVAIVALLTMAAVPSTTAAAVGTDAIVGRTVDDTSPPTPTTAVDTTVVETTVPPEELPAPEDDDTADAITWLAIGGSLVLLSIAAWWMARRSPPNHGDRPMDDDWPRPSEVV